MHLAGWQKVLFFTIVLLLTLTACARAEPALAVKGSLVFAGGALRFSNAEVWGRFVELAGGKGASVIVVPAAAGKPLKSGQAVVDNLKRYGVKAELVLI